MKTKKIKCLITLFILVSFASYFTYRYVKRYQYNHYWNSKSEFFSLAYSSEEQILQLNNVNDFVKNQQNSHGEFLTGQCLYNDGLKFSLEIYRQPSKRITCVVTLELTKETDLEYQYELFIYHSLNYTLEDRVFKLESINTTSDDKTLLKTDNCPLRTMQQYMFQCAEIRFWNYSFSPADKACATYVINFYVNYDQEHPIGKIDAKLDILSKNNYKSLKSLEMTRPIYLSPW